MRHDPDFVIARSLPLPGLGLLVLPQPPAPAWLATAPLHAAMRLRLHCPGQAPRPVPATVEEVAPSAGPPTRALLLDADLGNAAAAGAWLELLEAAPDELY